MSEIKRLTTYPDRRWNEYVLAHPDSTCCHLSEWALATQRLGAGTPAYLYYEEQGRIKGVLPLARVSHWLRRDALVSTPYCVYGGAIADTSHIHRSLEAAAIEVARETNAAYVELRKRSFPHTTWRGSDLFVTFRKALAADPERNLAAIPRKQRAMIRKGIKSGLTVSASADLDTFYSLYCASMHQLGTPAYARTVFEILLEIFGERADLMICEHQGKPVSAVLSLYYRDEVLPYYAGSYAAAREVAAADFMYWSLLCRAVEKGCRTFDFGRSMRGTGAFAFKKNWGFEPTPLFYEFALLGAKRLPVKDPHKPLYRCLTTLWRRAPRALIDRVGTIGCPLVILEAVSKLFTVTLAPKKFVYKAHRTANSGSMCKRCNTVDGLFGPNPKGRGLCSRISALHLIHLPQVNFSRRALNCANEGHVATVNNFEAASRYHRMLHAD